MKNVPSLKKSLALQLLKVVFSIYLCITVVVTLVQMYKEYEIEEYFVKNSLIISQNIFQESLIASAWATDHPTMEATVQGIIKQPTVVGIKITTEEGYVIQKGIGFNQENRPVFFKTGKEIVSSYLVLFKHAFPLIHQKHTIGKVTLYSSNQIVFNKVKQSFVVIIINAVIKTIALWWLFLWAFNRFLTRQLDIFCQAMEEVDLDKQKNCALELETFGTYELSRIEFFFNDLLKRIVFSRDKLNVLNKTLEQKVAERTLQLFEKQQALEQVNEELEQQISIIEKLVITDELTQLYNRRYFNRIFPKEIQRAAREKQAISFLIFDIDHFKQYNDHYGHQKGDDVLKTIGHVLKVQCQRASDIPLRLGGEEFGIIFSCVNHEAVSYFAERVREAIADIQIEHRFSSTAPFVTASFGLVSVPASLGLTMDDLYKQADDALYQAKETGRNKVVQVEYLDLPSF